MQRFHLLIGIILFSAISVSGQVKEPDTLIMYYNKYPRQALSDAKTMYAQALKKQDTPLLIKSLILKTTFTTIIDRAQFPEMASELEAYVEKEQDAVAQSILHSYLAELYLQYYNGDAYVIGQRTDLAGYIPEDINAWTTNIFKEKVFGHALASISNQAPLQTAKISAYNTIVIPGKNSATLRPTVYDFLCYRAIELLPQFRNTSGTPLLPEQYPGSLSGLDQFISEKIEAISLDDQSNTLKIYQELLRFRKEANNPDALLLANLDRLEYARNISQSPKKDSLYITTLQNMEKEYRNIPMSVEILSKEADYWYNKSMGTKTALLKKALQICEEGIRLYPGYWRINLLHSLVQDIKNPSARVAFRQNIYPGEKIEMKISSKNITKATIQVFSVDANITDYLRNKNKNNTNIPRKLIYEYTLTLPSTLTERDSIVTLPGVESGLYEFTLQTPESKKTPISDYFISSQLFATWQSIKKQNNFIVRDRMSGKPVKGAKIVIYDRKYPLSYQITDSVFTDHQGRATTRQQGDCFQVMNKENKQGDLFNLYNYNSEIPELSSQLELITDRKIYRPGQTVYFKGISWDSSPDSLYLNTDKKYNVIFRDANYKEITNKDFVTNDFGSFSGEFTIPAQSLNGNFTLWAGNGQTNITVADYKRPEFEITFAPSDPNYSIGDTIRIKGHINSFSGVNLSDNTLRYQIKGYTPYFMSTNGNVIEQGISQTDGQGNFEFKFKAKAPATHPWIRGRYFYKITVSATDPKGETQEASTEIAVSPKEHVLTIQTPDIINKEKINHIYFILNDAEQNKIPRTVKYTIAELNASGKISQGTELSDTLVGKIVNTGELRLLQKDSIQPVFKNYPSGAYLLTAICEGQESKTIFYLYAPGDKYPPISTYNWLVKEKTDCKPGENAQVIFGTSVKDAHILIETYSVDRLIKQEQKVISNKNILFEIPYKEIEGNQIWLVISYIKDDNYVQNVIEIKKVKENRKLTLQTKVFRDKLVPGQKEEWEFRVMNAKGEGVLAEILAVMYDASLDKIQANSWQFTPGYLPVYFRGGWENPYTPIGTYHLLYYNPPFSKQPNFKIPAFRFDQLNTYSLYPQISGFRNAILSEYGVMPSNSAKGSISTDQSIRIRGNSRYAKSADVAESTGQTMDAGTPPIDFRQDFQETAFFYPQIQTDSNGQFTLKFTVPDATTKWKFSALAYTKDLFAGTLEKYITTSKELMVSPNMPRFLRMGDSTILQAAVSNLSDKQQSGNVRLELFIPVSGEVIFNQAIPFSVATGQRTTVSFSIKVPRTIDLVGYRISAATETFSDGEQHLLPVLPDNVMVTETLPFYSTISGNHSFSLENKSKNREDFRLTLEVTANPIWYAVLALPTLREAQNENITDIAAAWYVNIIATRIASSNPEIGNAIRNWTAQKGNNETLLSRLEQNQELKSILLNASPWVLQAQNETERMQSLTQLFDQNRSSWLEQQALDKISALQLPDGSWSWFKNMPGNRSMTEYVLHLMAKANTTGQKEFGEKEKMMQIKALRYLDNIIKTDFEKKPARINESQLMYLYVRSMYRDIPLGDALNAHKYFMSLAQKQWGSFTLYEKAITATTMFHYGFNSSAKSILTSLRQYAETKPDMGMYWPNNQNNTTNAAVTRQVAILEAFYTIEGNTPDVNLMKQWLLRQKQTQSWASTPASVDAIYALLLTGKDQLAEKESLTISLGNKQLRANPATDPLGYIKQSYPAAEITPDMLTVKIEKSTDNPTWGGLYLQYFENLDQIRKTKGASNVDKQLFIEKANGNSNELYLLKNQPLNVGDKVVVRLTISLDRDMEFLHLKDLRAACFEPAKQLSGNQWKFGSVYYEEVQDAATNLFFNRLAKGTYVIEYPVWVSQSGIFQDGIATLQSIYAPEFSSFSSATKIEVKN